MLYWYRAQVLIQNAFMMDTFLSNKHVFHHLNIYLVLDMKSDLWWIEGHSQMYMFDASVCFEMEPKRQWPRNIS